MATFSEYILERVAQHRAEENELFAEEEEWESDECFNEELLEQGGYDMAFTQDIPDRLCCLLCSMVCRQPKKVDCCGRIFCGFCLMKFTLSAPNGALTLCPGCNEEDWKRIAFDTESDREIQSLMIKCTNWDSGCRWGGELRLLHRHLQGCSGEQLPCRYASIGCRERKSKKNYTKHGASCTAEHLIKSVRRILSLARRVRALETQEETRSSNPPPYRLSNALPAVFKMNNVQHYRDTGILWESPSFCTHPRGYKLFLRVFFEYDALMLQYLSVQVYLMRGAGDNDDNLIWPFRGVVHFELLNQTADVNHMIKKLVFYEGDSTERNSRVNVIQKKSDYGWGNKLMLMNCEGVVNYIQKNCLYIRVFEVQVPNVNKPWLI